MKKSLLALFCGIIFGIGLSLSQMINPDKVLGFLDITGNWDPSLAFVMIGAVGVTITAFRWILQRPEPILDTTFHIRRQGKVDKPLLIGATLFGIGWGMSGYCPGPVVTSLSMFSNEVLIMLVAIYLGFICHKYLAAFMTKQDA